MDHEPRTSSIYNTRKNKKSMHLVTIDTLRVTSLYLYSDRAMHFTHTNPKFTTQPQINKIETPAINLTKHYHPIFSLLSL